MPGAVAAVLSAATAVGTFLGFAGVAATIVGAIVVVGTVALATKAIKKKQQQQRAQQTSISGVLVTKAGTSAPIPVVYGQRRIAGTRIFVDSEGDKNKYLHVIETLCEGPIEGCTELYFADEKIAESSDNGANWSITNSSYNNKIDIKFFDGSQTSRISTNVNGVSSNGLNRAVHSNWPSGAVGNNVAYIYLVCEFDQDLFGGGLPAVTYTVKGKKLPAIGSDHDTTLTYSQEPARIIYDYLINPTYGKNIPFGLVDATTFNAAATYNSQSVQKTDDAADGNETRFLCNAYIDTSTPLLENLEELLTTCRAGLITGDTYKLIQDKPTTALSVTINDDNIVGNIQFIQANKATLLNHIRAKFPNEDTSFNFQEDITVVENTTLSNPNGSVDKLKLSRDIELQHTTSKTMCNRILTEEINQSRQSGIIEVKVDPSMIDLAVGDVVKFTNSTLGQTNKLYRIIKTVVSPDHTITLNMREYDNNVYWDNNKTVITNNKDDTDH